MPDFLLDSDVIIWFLRGRKDVVAMVNKLQRVGAVLCSAISLTEVHLGIKKGEEGITNDFLDALVVCPVDREVASSAGDLIRENKKGGAVLEIPDALIAASCLLNDFILVTCNKKHYRMFKGLKIFFE